MKIRTSEQFPGCWVAVDDDSYDGPGSKIGTGSTEQQAIDALLELLEDE